MGSWSLLAFAAMSFLLILVPGPSVLFVVGPVMERSVLVFAVLKLAGAAYLVHLGVKAWRERGALRASFAGVRRSAGGCAPSGRASGTRRPASHYLFREICPARAWVALD